MKECRWGYQLATAGRSRRVLRLVLARTYQLRDLSLDLTLSQVDIFVLFSQFYLA